MILNIVCHNDDMKKIFSKSHFPPKVLKLLENKKFVVQEFFSLTVSFEIKIMM
jgi:hypothetical protein